MEKSRSILNLFENEIPVQRPLRPIPRINTEILKRKRSENQVVQTLRSPQKNFRPKNAETSPITIRKRDSKFLSKQQLTRASIFYKGRYFSN